MTLTELRAVFPRTYKLAAKLMDERLIDDRCLRGLSSEALTRIETGETDRKDATALLMSRSRQR